MNNIGASWIFYASFSAFLGVLSCTLTTYYGPGASGSGVAELIGYVNGINYPETISIPTFLTKVFGVVLAVAGTLAVGKEGPLAHIGANLGAIVLYMFGDSTKFLHNDHKRRQFIAAGASAGVSVAFGAPIGGALFIFELSKPNPFWKFSMLWKTFLACSSAVFSLALLQATVHGRVATWTASSLKFGKVRIIDVTPSDVLPGAIILGIISGGLGAFFIGTNFKVNA
jgi:chloride channel 7